ncbi:YggS family pyridoxal phosphate-dependent enzyme [Pedobacter sp. MR2016-24]|uniref:YggS family pyridoxal phosphate-dependent enzyme n=1 Tax=Pedobacter sp. MR2016-24 TaxID=2994466 RepID=UPI00224681C5|nr:YggS family pyridoxal phosphate-dependent enzyme [Pedobacter sp. MR2016-24]MCX2484350.1 YggS family pyridoxal phosphate-dependent enzyme [Pedobacter sp. MR2016-24]
MSIADNLLKYKKELEGENVELIAVSKFNDADAVLEAYNAGQRIFGENIVQELVEKEAALPKDIAWHLIGHLQTNKVKYIAPFIQLIQSVDSLKLLAEIDKHAAKNKRVIDCLLQIYIADEETKFGLDHAEAIELLRSEEYLAMKNIRITGLMGIASNNATEKQTQDEFQELKVLFDGIKASFFRKEDSFRELSMGMSGDYKLAIEEGSTMIRIGSSIFGARKIKHYKA